ncbi:MAG: alpha-xenorhabdolysin family binary toxin subunit B [Morganella sp. (in: enterobacteria)]
MMNSDLIPEDITLTQIKHTITNINCNIETLSLPTVTLHTQIHKIKRWQTRILNTVSTESATIYSQLYSFDLDNLFQSISPETGSDPHAAPHEKQIYEFLIGQINSVNHSVNSINKQFKAEYDVSAIPQLQGDLLHHQSHLSQIIENTLPNIDKFISDKSYWEDKLAVIIQSEEIIHQRGLQSIFGSTTLPTAEQLKNVELSSSEHLIMNELYRVISAIINTLSEGLSYIQLVETRTILSQRIYDLHAVIRKLENELQQVKDQTHEVSNALVLLPQLSEFDIKVNAVLQFWLQCVQHYEPYVSKSVPLSGLDTIILAHRRYFSAFTGIA